MSAATRLVKNNNNNNNASDSSGVRDVYRIESSEEKCIHQQKNNELIITTYGSYDLCLLQLPLKKDRRERKEEGRDIYRRRRLCDLFSGKGP